MDHSKTEQMKEIRRFASRERNALDKLIFTITALPQMSFAYSQ